MTGISKSEILSPVGNREMLYAAVRSGADAVYLGAKDFSARRNAENFSVEELEEVVKFCHIRGVKVYLTLNILIKDSELESAFNLAKSVYNLGIDGIIIQDLGLAKILHEKLPLLPLHASTQMSVHSPSALPLLKELGFCQVVAGREMSKNELKELCLKAAELGMTVEAFVHGALCMSVSGQCLLSAFLGSRSGNRGLCAGPCRLPFKVSGGTGYDLSLKDLSLLEYIRELYEIGVRSFKIEGRMKRPEYVAAATNACRKALDTGRIDDELNETLKNVFSRQGFTAGYYEGKLGKDMFGIRTKEDVLAADNAFPKLHEIYRNELQRIALDLKIEIKRDKPALLTIKDGINTVSVQGEIPQTAQNKPLTEETALKNLCKFGSTPYYIENTEADIDDGLFMTAGTLNDLRRKATEELDKKRSAIGFEASDENYIFTPQKKKNLSEQKVFARFESISQIPENLSGIDGIILPIEENPESINTDKIPIIADIPRGIVNEKYIADRLKTFKNHGCKTAMCGNLAAVGIARNLGFQILAGQGLNIINTESLNQFSAWGIDSAIISCEQELTEICKINSHVKTGIIAYGFLPLMLFRNCPLKNGRNCNKCDKNGFITDRKKMQFPIRCRSGYSELFNSVPLWLADKKADFSSLDFIVLYFTTEEKHETADIISAYNKGLSPNRNHTRGLYYRGVI